MRENEPAVTRRGGLAVLDVAVAVALAVAAALWNASLHVVPTATGTWRGIPDPPSAVRVGVSVAFGVLMAWALSRFPATVRRPFVALVAAALPLAPVLTGRLRPLLVFQGGVLRLLAGAVLAVAIVRLASVRRVRIGHLPAALLFAAAFLFYCAWGGRVPGAAGPQGDEPHYLVMAQSLLSDGDLDLTDEFRNTGDLAMRDGHHHCDKAPGVSILALPVYAAVHPIAGGQRPRGRLVNAGAYLATAWAVSLPSALAVAMLYQLALMIGASPAAAAAIVLAYAFGTLALPYSTLFYGHQLAAAVC